LVNSRAKLAALALVLTLAGCGDNAASQPSSPTDSDEQDVIVASQDLGIVLPTEADLEKLGFLDFRPSLDSSGLGDFQGAWQDLAPEERAQVGLDARVQPIEIDPEICQPAFGFVWAVEDGEPSNMPVAAGRSTFSDDGQYQVSKNQRVIRVVAHRWASAEIAQDKFEKFADASFQCLSFDVLSEGARYTVKYGDQVLKSADQVSYLGEGGLLQLSGYVGDVTFTVNLKDIDGLGSKGGELAAWLRDELTKIQVRQPA